MSVLRGYDVDEGGDTIAGNAIGETTTACLGFQAQDAVQAST